MKNFTLAVKSLLLTFCMAYFAPQVRAQSILNPSDTVITFNATDTPALPAWNTIGKWARTVRVSYNTNNYKCYIYNSYPFRLHYPKSYNPTANDGKKYPILVFFHGAGEGGSMYDNELQLAHGGDVFDAAVTNGTFDGYVLMMQTPNGFWGEPVYGYIQSILDYMITNNKLDPFRINLNGLSAGGEGTWNMMFDHSTYTASALPMSNAELSYESDTTLVKFTPNWVFQGGLDGAPDPGTTLSVVNAMKSAGANITETLFPNDGHDTWDDAWQQPNFWPFVNAAYMSNPWPLFGHNQFCPGETISATLGVMAGMQAYQWRFNGTVIPSATSNTYVATQLGTYDCRVERNNIWSDWSHTPVVVSTKQPTVSPNITIAPLTSNVIPTLDTAKGITLTVPTGYATYLWQAVGGSTTLSTTNTLYTQTPGSYQVKVTEQFGCSSSFSNPYAVINANGANGPAAVASLTTTTVSQTALRLDWAVNPSQANPQTGFEVYEGTKTGGPYNLVALLGASATFDTVTGLEPANKYYFVVRAVNANAGSPASNEASGTTSSDTQPPTAPSNLMVTGTTRSTVSLSWTASTDNVGVTSYDVYVNGLKTYSTTGTSFVVDNLSYGKTYTFAVTARDFAKNISPFSNQVVGQALSTGWHYNYYTGTWSVLPNFSTLTPALAGYSPTLNLGISPSSVDFGFLWEGFLHVPVTGTYSFQTGSDDGSALYLGSLGQTTSAYNFSATPLVNNDGLHGTVNVNSANVVLQAGVYPIAVAYFQNGGGVALTASWSTPQTGAGNYVAIPLSALSDTASVNGSAPAAASNLVATALSFNKIGLTWTDNSNNETAFEIWRGTDSLGATMTTVGTVKANVTSYTDSGLNANTRYFYRVRAIGQFGESAFDRAGPGLTYNYYSLSSSPSILPNASTIAAMVPTATGQVNTISTAVAQSTVNFYLTFAGVINIPTTGSYTFSTTSDDGSNLYIDGTDSAHLIVQNDQPHGDQTHSGTVSLTAGVHTIYVPYFQAGGGFDVTARIQGPGIANEVIPSSMLGQNYSNATTQVLPTVPAAPTGFVSEGASTTSTVTMHWTDNATNEANYQVYRSANTDANYLLLATLPANTVSFTDTGLFANSVYYYKVRATNLGGNSAFSNEDSAHTKDHLPVLKTINPQQYMRYGTTLVLNVNASDSDAETLTVTTTNLPGFGTYTSTGNGTGTITFSPAQTNQGTYNTITVTVTDQHGGSAVDTFNLTVNSNYNPVITRPVANVSLNEKQTATATLTATDQNAGDVLTWSYTGLPGFASVSSSGGTSTLTLTPGYADGGSYPVQAQVSDGNHGFDTVTFTITVVPVALPTVSTYIHFDGTTGTTAASPWNNTAAQPAQNVAFTGLLDQNGANSGLTLTITTPWQSISYGDGTNVLGQTTGNNSGVYPDLVLNSGYFTDGTAQNVKVSGLDTSTKYNFTFFGTRGGVSDDRTTIYTVTGTYVNQSVSLQCASNTANTVAVNNVRPNADGTVILTLAKGANAAFGYWNALVVTKQYNDHTAPAAPRNLTGTIVNNSGLSLTWVAAAYNANSYQVYRSLNQAGPYTLLNPGATNPTQASYVDTGLSQNNTYYYYATATNNYGVSPSSDTFSVAVPNLAPALTAIAPISLSAGQVTTTNVTATDAPTDVITLAVSGLPSFATFVDNGNGTGVLTLSPVSSNIGTYTGVLTATDNHGASSTTPVNITVTLSNLRNVYINMNDGSASEPAQAAPWNNMNSTPNAGATSGNLKDDHGTATGFALNLVDTWTGANNVGPTTGNNSGVYPDNVMESFYYDNSGSAKHLTITGLSSKGVYNLIFYAGRASVTDNRITHYAIGSQSVQLNAASNTTQTVQINDVSPDATGTISITVTQDAGSLFAYLNAMQIQYSYDTNFYAPSGLTAIGPNKSTIQLSWASNSPASTTGFEIWRGTTPTGPFSLLNTVGGTVTTYTDSGLAAASSYFYEVRALAGTRQSAFSNIAGGSTVAYTVEIQFNDGSDNKAQGIPWNSTNTILYSGFTLPNLINTLGQPTSMNLNVIAPFEGYNDLGATTGNNSGIFPDNVMNGFFYNDFGTTTTLSISGLDYTSTYNLNFFGSRANPATSVVSTYQVGNQIVTQDATNNTSKTVQIAGIKPDSTGTITFLVYNTTGGRCYLNAMTIDGVPAAISNFAQTPVATQAINNRGTTLTNTGNSLNTDSANAFLTETKVTAFPNPWTDQVNLGLQLSQPVARMLVSLVDSKGRVLFRQEMDNLPQGSSVQPLNLNANLPTGTYFLLVQGLPDGKSVSLPMVKLPK